MEVPNDSLQREVVELRSRCAQLEAHAEDLQARAARRLCG